MYYNQKRMVYFWYFGMLLPHSRSFRISLAQLVFTIDIIMDFDSHLFTWNLLTDLNRRRFVIHCRLQLICDNIIMLLQRLSKVSLLTTLRHNIIIYMRDHNKLITPENTKLKLSYLHPKNIIPDMP